MQLSQNITLIQRINNHLRVNEGFNTMQVEKFNLDAGRLTVSLKKTSANNLTVTVVSMLRTSQIHFDLNRNINSTLEHLIVCCDCLISETL